jgi:hypothetical protein
MYSGGTHSVLSGVALFPMKTAEFCERTDVTFLDLSRKNQHHLNTDEPYDKAAIRHSGLAGLFVRSFRDVITMFGTSDQCAVSVLRSEFSFSLISDGRPTWGDMERSIRVCGRHREKGMKEGTTNAAKNFWRSSSETETKSKMPSQWQPISFDDTAVSTASSIFRLLS